MRSLPATIYGSNVFIITTDTIFLRHQLQVDLGRSPQWRLIPVPWPMRKARKVCPLCYTRRLSTSALCPMTPIPPIVRLALSPTCLYTPWYRSNTYCTSPDSSEQGRQDRNTPHV